MSTSEKNGQILEYNEGEVSGDTDVRIMSVRFQCYSYSVIFFPMLI